ncbi:MAG: VTC domain-containing protein [Solirubrobacterales bacterium]
MPLDPLTRFDPIALAALERVAELGDRMEVKYIVGVDQLEAMLCALVPSHRILEIDHRRIFRYSTTYYDTPDLLTFREHGSDRRRRFKTRRRRYLDTGREMLEVKLKGRRGCTVKHAVPYEGGDQLDAAALDFVRGILRAEYGRELPTPLVPALSVDCRRITLVETERGERVTCDIAVALGDLRLAPGYAIVESKSTAARAAADRALRELGARPVKRCSKYCLGVALTRPAQRANDFLPLMRRFFGPGPGPAVALGAAS